MKKIILILAYEPGDKLVDLVRGIDRDLFSVVVVDDGSGSRYDKIFSSIPKWVKVIRYGVNHGKGHALKVGFQYIKDHIDDNYIVVTMDSDGQHSYSDAMKLCDYVANHPDFLVLGMRKRDGRVPLRSRLGNGITKFIYGIMTGLDVYDTQTGLRAFSNHLMDLFLSIDGERFEYEMNVLLRCAKMKIPIHEIEIETIYIKNNSGTHFKTMRDSYLIYREIIKFSLSSLFCFVIDFILFAINLLVFDNVLIANILARIISAGVNYTINRNVVFKSDKNIYYSLFFYILLAVFILIVNTFLLHVLIYMFLLNRFIAKIVTEVILFMFSWFIQKMVIFGKKGNSIY